jgi:hypothetical protein
VRHFRRWGAVYFLALLFIGSWIGQAVAMAANGESDQFWAATLENWQSEWLQLVFQAVLLLGAKHWLFQVDAEDLERIDRKLDRLLRDREVVRNDNAGERAAIETSKQARRIGRWTR